MKVIRAIADLDRPAVVQGPLHLDALLSARHPAMHNQEETVTRKSGRIVIAPLPLSVARNGRDWVWCASAWLPSLASGQAAIVKRRDGIDYLNTRRTIYPAVGPERDRLLRYPTQSGSIEFLATVPDGRGYKELRRICRRVDQIGGLRKAGYGLVREWRFEEVDRDPRDCLAMDHADGGQRAARTMPAGLFAGDAEPQMISTIPPYWAIAEAKPAYAAGTRGRLCSTITIA
jgi:hypothetical protein